MATELKTSGWNASAYAWEQRPVMDVTKEFWNNETKEVVYDFEDDENTYSYKITSVDVSGAATSALRKGRMRAIFDIGLSCKWLCTIISKNPVEEEISEEKNETTEEVEKREVDATEIDVDISEAKEEESEDEDVPKLEKPASKNQMSITGKIDIEDFDSTADLDIDEEDCDLDDLDFDVEIRSDEKKTQEAKNAKKIIAEKLFPQIVRKMRKYVEVLRQ
ncbi:hypothetical protein PCE1_002590 [Barthelona sp. PCE]